MTEQHVPRSLIMAIDDDDMMRLMLHEILEQEGFEVVSAASGQLGLEMLKARPPALLFLDVMMPEMDGFACLQAIRAIPDLALLPVVMLTGADDIASINSSFQLGATDFIAKPISWPTLPHRLRYLLRASSALGQLAKSEAELRTAQKIAHLGSWDWHVATDTMQWSEEVFNVLGVKAASFKGRRVDLYRQMQSADVDKLHQNIESCLIHQQSFHQQFHIRHAKNADHIVLIRGEPVIVDQSVVRIHGTVQDITERQRIEKQIRFLSYYDPLTGLPNRKHFKEILGQVIAYGQPQAAVLSVLFISIDRFKRINETLGPNIGDRILKKFAERLVQGMQDEARSQADAINPSEMAVYRLGGNEFAVLLNPVNSADDSIKVAKSILQLMEASFPIKEHEIFLNINIGIAVYPEDGVDEDSFIKNGEFAMSHAKQQGQNTYQFFSKSLNLAAFHKLSMENNLRRAIERDELIVYYQPKVNMRNLQVIGCEALIRWQHPEFGLVSPAQFIPIAEDSGLITDISNWVLATACQQLHIWQQQGLPPLIMSVNVAANQFHQTHFSAQVQDILENLQLPPESLKLELTESMLMQNIEEALVTLCGIRALGVQISIDDFGTGYSSLAYLKKLPISELKIDRSFIQDIPFNEDDMAITKAILALAQSLSLEVVAEGVEHDAQAEFLMQHGCEVAQGFLYSKALPAPEFSNFLQTFGANTLLKDWDHD